VYPIRPFDGVRQSLTCTQGWLFAPHDNEEFKGLSLDDAAWTPVCLPHTNKELPHQDFRPAEYQFVSWYRKHLSVPQEWKGKRVLLWFDGAMTVAQVYVNGVQVGEHFGGYTPFSVDLTPHLDWHGANVVAVRVDSTRRPDVPPEGGVVDYMLFGGLYRRVYLECTEPVYIDDAFFYTTALEEQTARVEGRIAVRNGTNTGRQLTAVVDFEWPGGESIIAEVPLSVGAGVLGEGLVRIPVRRPKLWDPEHPQLYKVTVTLFDGERGPVDDVAFRFGVRVIEMGNNCVRVNGQPLKLRGLNRHQMFPYIGNAAPQRLQRRDAEILRRDLGLQYVRTSHYPQDPAFLDACDELGLLVLTELPGWQYIGDDAWQAIACSHLEELILRDRNRACVFMWGVRINESPDHHDFYTRTNAIAHALDPTRPTCGVRNRQGGEILEDVVTFNDFSMQALPAIRTPQLITEFVGHMFPAKSTDPESRLVEHALSYARVVDGVYGREDLIGSSGWCAFDYNTHPVFGTGSEVCYHGVMDMFRQPKWAAAFYQSQRSLSEGVVLTLATYFTHGSPEQAELLGAIRPHFDYDRDWHEGKMSLYVFSNCDEVELRVNGGDWIRQKPFRESFPHLPHPPFRFCVGAYQTIGRVEARGYCGDEQVANAQQSTPQGLVRLLLSTDDVELVADGSDMTRVIVEGVDEAGVVCPYANRVVAFSVDGPATLVGENPVALEGGRIAVYLRSQQTVGEVRIRVCGQGVLESEGTIRIREALERFV